MFFPKIDGRYELFGELALKPNVFSSDGWDREQNNKVRLKVRLLLNSRSTVWIWDRSRLNGWNMQRCICQLSSNEKIVLHSREFRSCKSFVKFEPTECKFCAFFDWWAVNHWNLSLLKMINNKTENFSVFLSIWCLLDNCLRRQAACARFLKNLKIEIQNLY